jgi:hypothetical protein
LLTLATGESVNALDLDAHDNGVGLALSSSGEWLAVPGNFGVKLARNLFATEDQPFEKRFVRTDHSVFAICFSPEKKLLATGSGAAFGTLTEYEYVPPGARENAPLVSWPVR